MIEFGSTRQMNNHKGTGHETTRRLGSLIRHIAHPEISIRTVCSIVA